MSEQYADVVIVIIEDAAEDPNTLNMTRDETGGYYYNPGTPASRMKRGCGYALLAVIPFWVAVIWLLCEMI